MKISNLKIRNFRGIRAVNLVDLADMVVIAGQNGSGKSCILDAIRLLKSVYGGYQQNEWHHWMGEFQINFSNRNDLVNLKNSRVDELRITCEFSLHSEERDYILQHDVDLIRQSVWRTMYPELYTWSTFRAVSLAAHLRGRESEIQAQVDVQLQALREELKSLKIVGEFVIRADGEPIVTPSKVLEVIFGTFRPNYIGVLDYHGPHRMYGRETLQGINLNLDAIEQQKSQHALYNYVNKYANVKSEMAASYIKDLLANEATGASQKTSLASTLQELFKTFFPEKEFLGPQPTANGTLEFPVRTADGTVHDLNELSAGEKEVLYGYLRLRNSAPRFSVILLDEPELHLNPRLIKGLPDFYFKNLGSALDNQIWLITHSDALLREAVGHNGYSVFHMQAANMVEEEQASSLHAKGDIEKVVIELVGDLASYRPNAKLIIFEGENSEFDRRMTNALFPTLQQGVNIISGGSKQRVQALHEVLEIALERGQIPLKIFSIVDADAESSKASSKYSFSWDVYHIENYLLEPRFILKVVSDLGISKFNSEEEIYVLLRECATETLGGLMRHRMGALANKSLVSAINLATNPNTEEVAPVLFMAISRSRDRLDEIISASLSLEQLKDQERELRLEYEAALSADTWRKKFRGREILKRFTERIGGKVSYEVLRDLILARMKDEGFEPTGMRTVITSVLDAK